jgi:hypothetical protein
MIPLSVRRWRIIFKDPMIPLVDRFCEKLFKEMSMSFSITDG